MRKIERVRLLVQDVGRPIPIMLVRLAFYAPSKSRFTPKKKLKLCSILKILMLLWFQKIVCLFQARSTNSGTTRAYFDSINFSFPFWCILDVIWIFRTLLLEEMISLHSLQNNFPSLTIKLSPGNCLNHPCNAIPGLSLYRCFLSACSFHWLILKIDLELSLKGLLLQVSIR